LYHYFATILGIRPVEVGFKRVAVTPLLGPLDSAEGVLVHPGGGEIRAQVRRAGDRLAGRITLPPGVSGVLRVNGEEIALEPGETGF
jgi:hypothetical protein